jgi:hypothetical protein
LSGLRAPGISLARLLVDYLTLTCLTPYYSESTMFNFLLIPILPTDGDLNISTAIQQLSSKNQYLVIEEPVKAVCHHLDVNKTQF